MRGRYLGSGIVCLIITAMIAAPEIDAASAAGPYEGSWRGASIATSGPGCSTTTTAAVTVQGDRVAGEDIIVPGSAMPPGRHAIQGNVASDGSFTGTVGDWDARGTFGSDSFSGDYEFGFCTMTMRLSRVR
jgi:hypothetical protein